MESDNEKRDNEKKDIEQKAIDICEGNPGAITLLGNIYAAYRLESEQIFNKLIKFGFRGTDIYKLYKNCDKKINIFVKTILELTEKP